MNSWAVSACYPRSTFYPLSDGPSTRDRRITKTCFRTCSTCMSRSQAPICLYARRLISDQPEGTIAHLRYSFGGDRPSQTTHQTVSLIRFHGPRLDFKHGEGGISRATPRRLAPTLQSLPPILHTPGLKSLSSYSKGSWGLSV